MVPSGSLRNAPHILDRHALLGRIDGQFLGDVNESVFGAGPDRCRRDREHAHDGVRGHAILSAYRAVTPRRDNVSTRCRRSRPTGDAPDPRRIAHAHLSAGIPPQSANREKTNAVEADEAGWRAQPQVTVLGLQDRKNRGLRQPLRNLPYAMKCLRDRTARLQGADWLTWRSVRNKTMRIVVDQRLLRDRVSAAKISPDFAALGHVTMLLRRVCKCSLRWKKSGNMRHDCLPAAGAAPHSVTSL